VRTANLEDVKCSYFDYLFIFRTAVKMIVGVLLIGGEEGTLQRKGVTSINEYLNMIAKTEFQISSTVDHKTMNTNEIL
jgi:hypothetical protein